MTTTKHYSPEVLERAVNLVLETQHKHDSQVESDPVYCIKNWLHTRDAASVAQAT